MGYSGGIAQNTIINKVLKDAIPNLVIPPHANDQGLSVGIIEYLRREYNLDEFDRGLSFCKMTKSVADPLQRHQRHC